MKENFGIHITTELKLSYTNEKIKIIKIIRSI